MSSRKSGLGLCWISAWATSAPNAWPEVSRTARRIDKAGQGGVPDAGGCAEQFDFVGVRVVERPDQLVSIGISGRADDHPGGPARPRDRTLAAARRHRADTNT